jgi:hypothetical protein
MRSDATQRTFLCDATTPDIGSETLQRGFVMKKLFVFIGATVVGWFGWWLGAFVGMTTAFMIGMIGTGVGMYVGARLAKHYGA